MNYHLKLKTERGITRRIALRPTDADEVRGVVWSYLLRKRNENDFKGNFEIVNESNEVLDAGSFRVPFVGDAHRQSYIKFNDGFAIFTGGTIE